ncbi:SnoaL-like domain-containing protein [Luteibacter jiangsuensis]|uniref:SnoaL-like domain-containing protein n=1 Tax=Luteibacter jiangsuensis TaxID=637577 RepID=A0ABX0Q684_9GAMM|nr:VOC family protein [Luteibacter jiangsuensis]NID05868.1 SnoaL-like domain-containing protein [Luteibacter jiangsuensis]
MKLLLLPTALAAAALLAFTPTSTAATPESTGPAPAIDVRGVDHVGINVPDVNEAARFFRDMFGFVPVTDMEDIPVDAAFKTTFNMHADAKVKAIRMLRAGDGANIELFQFDAPDSVRDQPHYDDIGSSHIALYTDDIDKAVATLRAKGIKVLTDPIRMTQGPASGNSWVYFITPWGSKMELVSYPNGQAGERAAGVQLWKAPKASGKPLDRTIVDKLVKNYVGMLNDRDATSRAKTIDACYTYETVFNDPEGLIEGKAALNTLVGKLQATNKNFEFRVTGAVTIQNGAVRVPWSFGPAAQPKKITGEDILTIIDGKIAGTTVFLNGGPH